MTISPIFKLRLNRARNACEQDAFHAGIDQQLRAYRRIDFTYAGFAEHDLLAVQAAFSYIRCPL